MTSLASLWLPILLSAVFVFVVSSLVHMVLQLHKNDYQPLPDENGVLATLRNLRVGPGQYVFPHCKSMKDFGDPAVQEKFKQGPIGTMIVRPSSCMNMGTALSQWFAYCIVVSIVVAYLTGLARAPGANDVFRVAAATALLGYGFSSAVDSIWKGVAWSTTAKFFFDGVLYALTTGAVFAWLWPAAA
jgi:hypothetical protein